MRKTIKTLLTLAICATGISHVNAQSIGKAVKADRTVSGSRSGVLQVNSSVFANERLQANQTGLGHIEFNDGTKMVLGPGTNLVLDEAIYSPGGSTFRKFAIDSSAGALRFISGSSRRGTYEIQTPTGTLGIRGTEFDLQHYRGRTYIMLVSGRIEFCSNSGNCETIRRRCDYIVAHPDGRVDPPVQPRRGIYEGADMERYFPFINDQSDIEPDFRLRVNRCSGGASFAGVNEPGNGESSGGSGGDTNGGDTTGGNTSGGDNGDGDSDV